MARKSKKKLKKSLFPIIAILLAVLLINVLPLSKPNEPSVSLDNIPEYSGKAYCVINNNVPSFTQDELSTVAYETYAKLDYLGRCGVCEAVVGKEIMPTEPRDDISSVKPSGWINVPYSFVDGGYLYNRCHLIGFQLTGENANKQNLITGTRYMNTEGMLPFENMIADYVKETGKHVLYRVTPIFKDDELVARGVLLEAMSVEDNGEEICFCVYTYNVQPGVIIDYKTGASFADESKLDNTESGDYVLNTSSKKFHKTTCSGVSTMSSKNRQDYSGNRADLISQGYVPCSQCNP